MREWPVDKLLARAERWAEQSKTIDSIKSDMLRYKQERKGAASPEDERTPTDDRPGRSGEQEPTDAPVEPLRDPVISQALEDIADYTPDGAQSLRRAIQVQVERARRETNRQHEAALQAQNEAINELRVQVVRAKVLPIFDDLRAKFPAFKGREADIAGLMNQLDPTGETAFDPDVSSLRALAERATRAVLGSDMERDAQRSLVERSQRARSAQPDVSSSAPAPKVMNNDEKMTVVAELAERFKGNPEGFTAELAKRGIDAGTLTF